METNVSSALARSVPPIHEFPHTPPAMKSLCLLLASTAIVATASARPALEKPNLIVILLDDAGYADFSHTGHPTIQTPAISKLAADGANFTQYYCAAPACTASRYGLAIRPPHGPQSAPLRSRLGHRPQ